MTNEALTDLLRGFEPFDRLSDGDLIVLAARTKLLEASASTTLFERGDKDTWILYLHAGTVTMTAADGKRLRLDASTPSAALPMSRFKPRLYTAVADTPVRYLCIDETGLGDLQNLPAEDDYVVEEVGSEEPHGPAAQLGNDLVENDLTLPSLPTIALQVTRSIDKDEADVATVARIVMTDPPIAAKLIRSANSAIFHGRGEINTCDRAIARLGLASTRRLVLAFALGEIFRVDTPALRARMEALWEHSTNVAAIAFVLARTLGTMDPDEAQLAGLVHDIGIVPILHRASQDSGLADDAERLDYLSGELRAMLGERILRKWNFPSPLIVATRDAEQWWRDPHPDPELADLIVVAQIISFFGTQRFPLLPPLARLPAFAKLTGGRLDPAATIEIIRQAHDQIRELQGLLRR